MKSAKLGARARWLRRYRVVRHVRQCAGVLFDSLLAVHLNDDWFLAAYGCAASVESGDYLSLDLRFRRSVMPWVRCPGRFAEWSRAIAAGSTRQQQQERAS